MSAGLSAGYFRTAFRRLTGMSARAYLTAQRMRAARFYLRETSMSIKEIAAACGYQDALYFSRHYKEYWRHAPSAERTEPTGA